jgi:hypothetical protein
MHDHVPPPRTLEARAQSWVRAILWPTTVLVAALVGWTWFQAGATQMPPSASAPEVVSAGSDLRELIAVLATPQAIEVTLPDTLVVTTPTPEPLPTKAPVTTVGTDVCTDNTPKGTVCQQPKEPMPPPTAVPDCPVVPGRKCVSTGEPVTWLPTSVPIADTTVSYVPGGPN